MFTLLGTVAGAAAVKLLNKHKAPTDVKELQQQKRELERLVKDLQKQVEATQTSADSKNSELTEIMRQAEELKVKVDNLASENVDLKETHSSLSKERQELVQTVSDLSIERTNLQRQVEVMTTEHEAVVRDFQQQLDSLRSKVSDIVGSMLAHSMTDDEAVEAMKGLGCTVEYIEAVPRIEATNTPEPATPDTASDVGTPAATTAETTDSSAAAALGAAPTETAKPPLPAVNTTPAFSYQGRCLLEDRDRLERLVVSSKMGRLDTAGNGNAKIPMVTFPMRMANSNSMKDMSSSTAVATTTSAAAAPAKDAPGTPAKNAASVADIRRLSRDQQPSADTSKAADKKGAPAISFGTPGKSAPNGNANSKTNSNPAIQFMYSLQGSKGNTWVAKVPVASDAPATTSLFSNGTSLSADASGLLQMDDIGNDFDFGGSASDRTLVAQI